MFSHTHTHTIKRIHRQAEALPARTLLSCSSSLSSAFTLLSLSAAPALALNSTHTSEEALKTREKQEEEENRVSFWRSKYIQKKKTRMLQYHNNKVTMDSRRS